jgi:hypothetical protein
MTVVPRVTTKEAVEALAKLILYEEQAEDGNL